MYLNKKTKHRENIFNLKIYKAMKQKVNR